MILPQNILFLRIVPKDLEQAILFGSFSHLPQCWGIRNPKANYPCVILVVDVPDELWIKAALMPIEINIRMRPPSTRGQTSSSSKWIRILTSMSPVIPPCSDAKAIHGIVLPLNVQVGPPGKRLPGPLLAAMFMLPLSLLTGGTQRSWPACQISGTSLFFCWKITAQHTASSDAEVNGINVNLQSVVEHSIWGTVPFRAKQSLEYICIVNNNIATLPFAMMLLVPAVCPYFFYEVLHLVSSAFLVAVSFVSE